MYISQKEFEKLKTKYPKSTIIINQLLCFEDRMDMLLVEFRGKRYEVEYPPNFFINSKKQ